MNRVAISSFRLIGCRTNNLLSYQQQSRSISHSSNKSKITDNSSRSTFLNRSCISNQQQQQQIYRYSTTSSTATTHQKTVVAAADKTTIVSNNDEIELLSNQEIGHQVDEFSDYQNEEQDVEEELSSINVWREKLFKFFNHLFINNSTFNLQIFLETFKTSDYQTIKISRYGFIWLQSINCQEIEAYNQILSNLRTNKKNNIFFSTYYSILKTIPSKVNLQTYMLAITYFNSFDMYDQTRHVFSKVFKDLDVVLDERACTQWLKCDPKKWQRILNYMAKNGVARTEEFNSQLIWVEINIKDDVDRAIEIFEKDIKAKLVRGGFPESTTYHLLLVSFLRIARLDLFDKYWNEMESFGVMPLESTISVSINKIHKLLGFSATSQFYHNISAKYEGLSTHPKILAALVMCLISDPKRKGMEPLIQFLDHLEERNLLTFGLLDDIIGPVIRHRDLLNLNWICEDLLTRGSHIGAFPEKTLFQLLDLAMITNNPTFFVDYLIKKAKPMEKSINLRSFYSKLLYFYIKTHDFGSTDDLISKMEREDFIFSPKTVALLIVYYDLMRLQKFNQYHNYLFSQTSKPIIAVTIEHAIQYYLIFDHLDKANYWLDKHVDKITQNIAYYFLSFHILQHNHSEITRWKQIIRDLGYDLNSTTRFTIFNFMQSNFSPLHPI
ncbi:hypothetical protein DFA_11419 [Cavenderia fasciculata]|uniref:Pentatricopeptide repeat-containing protein n=1 Tax=Cavenderia fasciculata TaxID=261658 RepID=F4QCS6_CACFS|nr:uncharacterized protein DFA_11419 [Cavenderia fasciculata]EGG13658.1 hypothetical protein DFA_11419 [Cavenderia fasciculata]|eukprot:XP_004350362.1 hypothetical protein DFA_11419 [Cavenderia fasciculata]